MAASGWSLEVVRGREAGRRYDLTGPEAVIGNAPGVGVGVDLSSQEADGPRRMAARQAVLELTGRAVRLRDLDSPGGTFVNRRRVLPGQAQPLADGDLIQVGAVQLRLVASSARPAIPPPPPPPPPPPAAKAAGPAGFPYTLPGGASCRSWDDLLRVAAQRWAELRAEVDSGRIDAWLRASGRPDLLPPRGQGDPDDRLDAWLGLLPATIAASPDLDVHPARVAVRATEGAGTVVRSIKVANVGHRLLRIAAAIEPGATTWARVVDPPPGRTRSVADGFDLKVEFLIPASLPSPLVATLRIDGNGGTRRVALEIGPKVATDGVETVPEAARPVGPGPLDRLAAVPAIARLGASGLVAPLVRLVVGVLGGTLGADGMAPSDVSHPGLAGVALGLAVLGGIAGARGSRGFGAISGAVAGAGLATALVATVRAIEPLLGANSGSFLVVLGLWTGLGLGLAVLSLVLAPPKGADR